MTVGVGRRTHTLSLKHVSDNLLCAMRITLSTEKELDQLCPKSFHWNDGCEVRTEPPSFHLTRGARGRVERCGP
jgi:hypothetical protein